jgi:hypothetical protein
MTTPALRRRSPDPATTAAIALFVYVAASVVHEVIGHAGSGLLFGVRPAVISSTYVSPATVPAAAWQRALTSAAGGLANLVFAFLAHALQRVARGPRLRFACWLAAAVNFFFFGSYLAASSLFGFGDWNDVARELAIPAAGRVLLAAAGAAVCLMALRMARRSLAPFLPSDPAARRGIARRLVRTSWLAGTVVVGAAALAGSRASDLAYALAWSLGGTCWLLILPAAVSAGGAPHEPLELTRSLAWIAGGLVLAILYIALLGRGLHFGAAASTI